MSEMARVTHVKRAQQRYAMTPVIDPATGRQQETAVTTSCRTCRGTGEGECNACKGTGRRGSGQCRNCEGSGMKGGTCLSCNGSGRVPKVSKRGPVIRRATAEDRSKPLEMPTCDRCRETIEVGQPYMHISPKSGPYGGTTRFRCGTCPVWHVWEYSNSLDARLAQIEYEATNGLGSIETADDAADMLNSVAGEIRELSEEKRQSADNIEEGFGHETSASQELSDLADGLESWADDIEGTDIPEYPEPGEGAEEPTAEQVDEWRAEVTQVIEDALSNRPF